MDYKVVVGWDAEKGVFFVVESDIEGLWAEARSFEELLDVIRDVAPDLIAHNHAGAAPVGLRILEDRGRLMSLGTAA